MSMLIVKACGVPNEAEECNMVKAQAEAYGLTTTIISPTTKQELEDQLESVDGYDFIYVSSHGNQDSLCNHDKSIDLTWLEFGLILCESGALNDDTIIMLSCCRGGHNQVAYALFHSCPSIRYVVGARAELSAYQMHICYGLLLYLIVQRSLDPVVACEKIKIATDIRFFFSDRLEMETQSGYTLSLHDNAEKLYDLQKERGWDFGEEPGEDDESTPVPPKRMIDLTNAENQ